MRSNGSGGVGVRQGGGWNVSHRAGNAKRRRPSSPPPPRHPRLRAIPHCLHMALLPHNPSLAAPALIAIQCCELYSRIPLSAIYVVLAAGPVGSMHARWVVACPRHELRWRISCGRSCSPGPFRFLAHAIVPDTVRMQGKRPLTAPRRRGVTATMSPSGCAPRPPPMTPAARPLLEPPPRPRRPLLRAGDSL